MVADGNLLEAAVQTHPVRRQQPRTALSLPMPQPHLLDPARVVRLHLQAGKRSFTMVELAESARRASQPCAQQLAQANLPAYRQPGMPSAAAVPPVHSTACTALNQ